MKMRPLYIHALAAGLLLRPGAVRADIAPAPAVYQIQPIVKQGDTIEGITIAKDADFEIGGLNDQGQLAFVTENLAGGEVLFQYADGQFTPIVAGGQPAPKGIWPRNIGFGFPVSLNQRDEIAFSVIAAP